MNLPHRDPNKEAEDQIQEVVLDQVVHPNDHTHRTEHRSHKAWTNLLLDLRDDSNSCYRISQFTLFLNTLIWRKKLKN